MIIQHDHLNVIQEIDVRNMDNKYLYISIFMKSIGKEKGQECCMTFSSDEIDLLIREFQSIRKKITI